MAKPKLSDLLKGTTGMGEPSAPVDPVVPGSPPPAVPAVPAAGGGVIRPRRVPTESEMKAQARRLVVRGFVRAFLSMGSDSFGNAAASFRAVFPDTSASVSKVEGHRLAEAEDTKEEMARQLRGIDRASDLNDQWVYDRWRAIADTDIFDLCKIDADGVVHFDNLDPTKLTKEQRFAIQEIQVDQRTGRIKSLKLANKNIAVANVARARQMIDGKRDPGMVDLAKTITERMNRAASRRPEMGRLFNNDGEQV